MAAKKTPAHVAPGAVAKSLDSHETVVLPSGATAKVRREWRGSHLRLAARYVPNSVPGSFEWGCALIAIGVTIDGRALTLEDVDDLWANDVYTLIQACMGNDGSRSSSERDNSPSSASTEATPTES